MEDKLDYMVNMFIGDNDTLSLSVVFTNEDDEDVFEIHFKKNSFNVESTMADIIIATFINNEAVESVITNISQLETVVYGDNRFYELFDKWCDKYNAVNLLIKDVSEFFENNDETKKIKNFLKDNDYTISKNRKYFSFNNLPTNNFSIEEVSSNIVYILYTKQKVRKINLSLSVNKKKVFIIYKYEMEDFLGNLFIMGDPLEPEKLDVIALPQSNERLIKFIGDSIMKRYSNDISKFSKDIIDVIISFDCSEEVIL